MYGEWWTFCKSDWIRYYNKLHKRVCDFLVPFFFWFFCICIFLNIFLHYPNGIWIVIAILLFLKSRASESINRLDLPHCINRIKIAQALDGDVDQLYVNVWMYFHRIPNIHFKNRIKIESLGLVIYLVRTTIHWISIIICKNYKISMLGLLWNSPMAYFCCAVAAWFSL